MPSFSDEATDATKEAKKAGSDNFRSLHLPNPIQKSDARTTPSLSPRTSYNPKLLIRLWIKLLQSAKA